MRPSPPWGQRSSGSWRFAYDSPVEGRWPAELLKTVCSKAAPDNVVLEPRHDSYCMLLGTHKRRPIRTVVTISISMLLLQVSVQ